MCLAVPMRLLTVDGARGQAEIDGVGRTVMLDLTPEARVGDYVIVHAGYAISILDEAEALETLRLFEELSEIQEGIEPQINADGHR
jgi:hydrogenase expression/formation protein HypC